jgi:hypothetical protein
MAVSPSGVRTCQRRGDLLSPNRLGARKSHYVLTVERDSKEEMVLLTEESTRAAQVIGELATDQGYTLETLAEEMVDASRGRYDKEEALGYLTDSIAESGMEWLALLKRTLDLNKGEIIRLASAP